MGFEKFGQVSFTAQSKIGGTFVDYLEKGELRATKCKECGEIFFPPRADCSKCLSEDMEWILIEGTGSVISYTNVHYGPTGFETDVPYILALADFDGIRVFGRFNKGIQEEQIKIGMPVKAEAINIDGQFSYEFLLA